MRYIYILIILLCSCSKNSEGEKQAPLKIETTTMEILSGDSKKIVHNGISPNYNIEDNFYIDVDNTGLITAKKVGSTKVSLKADNGTGAIEVKILPRITNVIDPINMLQKQLAEIVKEYGLVYTTKNNGDISFKLAKGNTIDSLVFGFASGMCYKISSYTLSNNKNHVIAFLQERYIEGTTTTPTGFLFNKKGTKTMIMGILRDVPMRPDLKNYEMLYFNN